MPISVIIGMKDFQHKIIKRNFTEENSIIGVQTVISSEFVTEYINAANRYAEFNKQANHGNINYWKKLR